MADRTNATPKPSGILRPDQLAQHTRLEHTACDPALSAWVEHHWTLAWDLPPGTTFPSQTLPHPCCHLTVELGHPRSGVGEDRVVLTGVVTRRFDVTLAASGWVHGVRFRPGGLTALLDVGAGALADRTAPARDLVPETIVEVLRSLALGDEPAEAAGRLDAALLDVAPEAPDPSYDLLVRLDADMLADRGLLRVAQLEDRHGVGRRRLERLFARYVGVGAKWVLARYRMLDVVAALDDGYDGSLADLAATYGWYDQAHFTRDFTGLVGVPPGEYRVGG